MNHAGNQPNPISLAEANYIEAHYQTQTIWQLCTRLKRGRDKIREYMYWNKLEPFEPDTKRPLSQVDIDYIYQVHKFTPVKVMAGNLGRGNATVYKFMDQAELKVFRMKAGRDRVDYFKMEEVY